MKKISTIIFVLLATMSFATNYYIDATNGNDNQKGTTPQMAWQSIEKVNNASLNAGDSVLFKRGEIFRGNLVPISGSAKGSITYGAYGTGSKPKLFGSIEKNALTDWVTKGDNIWQTEKQSVISIEVGNIIFNNESFCGIKVKSETELTAQGKFWYDKANASLKIYSISNPASFYSDIELALTRNIIDENFKNYITYENLDLRYGAAHAIGGGATHHIWIKDLDISWIGGGYLRGFGDGEIRYGNGVEFWSEAHDNIVERSTFNQIYDAALTNQGDETSGYETYNIYFRNNLINNSEYSFELWGRPAISTLHHIYFENNTCLNAGFGWGHAQRPDPNGTHLIFWGFSAKSNNIFIRNNIFSESSDYSARYFSASEFTKVIIDYNCWYESSGLVSIIGKTSYDYATQWNAFQKASGQDKHSIAVNPMMNVDYTIDSRSKCIDAGITTQSVLEDYLHVKRPQGPHYDIGAFETVYKAKSKK